jgi:1,4-alpha-glucan branching enzyme
MHTSTKWKETHNEKLFFMNTTLNHADSNPYSVKNSRKPVSFFCRAPGARSVELVGDFNHWRPLPMQKSMDSWWLAQVELCHGHHQYRFLVDGGPILDPSATGVGRDERGERVSLIAVS